jgi:hypothetical protein
MNYGRFFRLNLTLSKVEDGVAIYDYVDLPAYFGPSVDNPMSPKYPISVFFTSECVCFGLHYNAFKISKGKSYIRGIETKQKNESPRYAYDINEINDNAFPETRSDLSMAHMGEIILELPFLTNTASNLSDTIKEIYFTTFPQVINAETSLGGRFLEILINKRFPRSKDWSDIELLKKNGNLESIQYGILREVADDSPSFSSLWLMDLLKEERINEVIIKRIDLYDKKDGRIVGFLRKLLLDFMFDLKHSDVFKNSAYYQKMYSGLMSNFFFSALMHKCEYYYYRQLISDKLISNFDRDAVVTLYAEELSRAEDLWVKDIMSPQSEEHFYFKNGKKDQESIIWPTWFADPEEEMRRICFTIRNDKASRVCNMDVLIKLIEIDKHKQNERIDPLLKENIVKSCVNNKKLISQWFLRRYDFKDVFHLHLFKHANRIIFSLLGGILFVLLSGSIAYDKKSISFPSLWDSMSWLASDIGKFIFGVLAIITIVNFILFIYLFCKAKWRYKLEGKSKLLCTRHKMVIKRVLGAFIATFSLLVLYICITRQEATMLCVLFIVFELVILLVYCFWDIWSVDNKWNFFSIKVERGLQHVMSNIHLLLPRLIASVTAAWVTMTIGFDLFVAFFDESPHFFLTMVISVILILFVMFEVNKVNPYGNAWNKLCRSFELILISYSISLVIGLVVINFLGFRYLERGGFVGEGDFITQYVEAQEWSGLRYKDAQKNGDKGINVADSTEYENNVKTDIASRSRDPYNLDSIIQNGDSMCTANDSIRWIMSRMDTIMELLTKKDSVNYFRKQVARLDSVYHTTDNGLVRKGYAIMENIKLVGGVEIFVLRDFLIMFAFVAMFMGIFIQLIIFGGNKQMTEL